MKKIIALGLLCLSGSLPLFSNDILPGVNPVVDNTHIEDISVGKVLLNKIERSLSEVGINSADDSGLFLAINLIPLEEKTVEGGMRKIKITTYELSLELLHPILGNKFGTFTLTLNGQGYDKRKTMLNAISNLNPSSSSLTAFLEKATRDASNFYAGNLTVILDKAKTLSKDKRYDEAIALLWSLPVNNGNHDAIYGSLIEIYTKMQTESCQGILQKANNAYALKNYEEALYWLNALEPESPCKDEALKLTSAINQSYRYDESEKLRREEEKEKRKYQMIESDKQRSHELKTYTIDAIANVASAFFSSKKSLLF